MIKFIISIPRRLVQLLIRVYQKLFSFDHSFWAHPEVLRICNFQPSCSEYSYQALEKHGVIKGSAMGLARIMRCNGWTKGGYDPVPEKFSLKRNTEDHL